MGAVKVFNANQIWEYVIAVLLATAGGMARILNHHLKDQKKLKRSRILSELFLSGFAGFMTLLFARGAFGLTGDWIGLVCGMAGWIGPRILDLLAKPAGQAIGIDLKETKKEKED